MRSLRCVLNVWVAYLVCCQVMFMCVGLQQGYSQCVCVCVCTDSVHRSSWKESCVAENFLRSLAITNSWKRPVTHSSQWQWVFWRTRGHSLSKWSFKQLKRRHWKELWLFMSNWYHLKTPHRAILSVSLTGLISNRPEVSSSADRLRAKWKYILNPL